MKNTENIKQNTKTAEEIKQKVLSRIKNEKLHPTSWYFFFCINCTVWILWGAVLLIGTIAVTESIYVSMHSGFEFYEITHGSLANFILDSLPYVWFFLLLVMMLLAEYNIKKTKHGYKYTLWQIFFSNILLTVVLGYLLQVAGGGKVIDTFIGRTLPMYESVEARQEYLWTHPQDGRITGKFDGFIGSTTDAKFHDVTGRDWILDTHEMSSEDLITLTSGEHIRLMGEVVVGEEQNTFYSCATFSWDSDGSDSLKDIQEVKGVIDRLMNKFNPHSDSDDVDKSESLLRCRKIMSDVLYRNYPAE